MGMFFLFVGVLLGGVFCILLCCRFKIKNIIKNYFKAYEAPHIGDVKQQDIAVLSRARELLARDSDWCKNYFEHCLMGEKLTLYCALALAAKEITGEYKEKETYRQLLLEKILEKFPARYRDQFNPESSNDPLKNFNNHQKTSYPDVLILLDDVLLRHKTQEIK